MRDRRHERRDVAKDRKRHDQNVVDDGKSEVLPHQPRSGSRDAYRLWDGF